MMRVVKIIPIILVFLIVGCAGAQFQKISEDTFVATKTDHRGVFGSSSSFKKDVINDAQSFAAEQGGVAVKISSHFTPNGLGKFATFSYEFRVMDEVPDINAASRASQRCLIERVIDYDDGTVDVDSVSKAVANRCKKLCVNNMLAARSLPVSESTALRENCISDAADIVFRFRSITRNGGEVKRYNSMLYVKRKGDAHYQMYLNANELHRDISLSFQCQKGSYSTDIDTYSVELEGESIFKDLKLEPSSDSYVGLSVNGKLLNWSVVNGNEVPALSIPIPKLNDFISRGESLVIENNKQKYEFDLAGYKDAIKKFKTDCPMASAD
jgi:hypothetical protein